MFIIYTDGSALRNGAKDAPGGFGVVVCEATDVNNEDTYTIINAYQESCVGTTNNREEMKAILWAVKNYGTDGFVRPIVYTDSSYCERSFNEWIRSWKASGWRRAKNKPLENTDLIKEYDRLTTREGKMVDLRRCPGHAGITWNELADGLATGRLTVEEVLSMPNKF